MIAFEVDATTPKALAIHPTRRQKRSAGQTPRKKHVESTTRKIGMHRTLQEASHPEGQSHTKTGWHITIPMAMDNIMHRSHGRNLIDEIITRVFWQ
jgi:hypothetical protein